MAGIRKADRYAEEAAGLAVAIALRIKQKGLKDNGRRLSDRSWNQYLRGPFKAEVCRILSTALLTSGRLWNHGPSADPSKVLRSALVDLSQQLNDIARPVGRPKRLIGIMASHGKRAANRPRAMSLEDERSWVDHVRGAALRAWVLRNTLTNSHHRSDVNLAARLFNSNAGYSNSERKAALARFMSKAMDAGAKLAPPARNRKALQKRLLAGHRLYELPKKVRGVSE